MRNILSVVCLFLCLPSYGISMRLGSILSSVVTTGDKEKVVTKVQKLCIPDTQLPEEFVGEKHTFLRSLHKRLEFLLNLTGWSSVDLVSFALLSAPIFPQLTGKPKKDTTVIDKAKALYSKKFVQKIAGKNLPSDYQFFSNGDTKTIIENLVKHNPFYASGLSSKGSLGPKLFLNTYGGKKTWFSRLIDTMDKSYPRVNIVFSENLEIESYEVFDLSSGKAKQISMGVRDACAYAGMFLTFYSQCVHALIHVFNMIMINALSHSAKGSTSITDFSAAFEPNIGIKYLEVSQLLFKDRTGALTGGYFACDGTKVKSIIREMLCDWGSRKSADDFLNGFLFAGLSKSGKKLAESAGVLGEYRRHLALAAPFASDVSSHFASSPALKLNVVETKLTSYLSRCGADISKVSSLKQWIELMAAFGIMHGGTLSMSRNMITPEVFSKISLSDKYTKDDTSNLQAVFGTTVGIIDGHHVYGSAISKTKDKKLEEILKRYDTLSSLQKELYFNSIKTDPLFSKFGWIWTDYAPDLVDGKQLTITTYI